MKISFYQQNIGESEKQYTEKAHTKQGAGRTESVSAAAFVRDGGQQAGALAAQGVEKGKSLIELQQEAGNIDVGVLQDYMILMSNTMSEEDYARMQEEGFDFSGMEPEEAVTIVDRIKAELVRSGKNIQGYTDDMDLATLAAALGSSGLAQAVADSFAREDIPLTKENVEAVAQAWIMGSSLQPGEESYRYLIDNEMEPEIWNLYLAENSGAGQGGGRVAGFYEEDVKGYYAQQYTGQQPVIAAGDQDFQRQIDRVIEQSGREVDQESRELAAWLLDRRLPLTRENLDRLEELRQVELPVTEEAFARAAADAVAAGKSPVRASLGKESGNLYEKAVAASEYYHGSEAWEKAAGDITARRQLEEIRLRMTAEVNVKLLKSGFAIDTAPMEQLVQALKQAEEELAAQYFPGDTEAVEKYRAYQNVNAVVAEIPALPADVLGTFAAGQHPDIGEAGTAAGVTPEELHGAGKALRDSYEKAQTSYEALMTSPRADLGDNIRKAFANVDDILKDLGVELNEENRRAARILGYNRMEMTLENLEAVREADRQVKTVVEKLTPASTLKMIRDGINPLEKSFDELEQYFDELPEEYKDAAQSYSRFLYHLEKNRKITGQERESYIGIYRLVRQIEKTDGAAVGALVNTRAQLQFANLLTAVRTGRVKSLDMKAADQLGGITELVRRGESISEQIARAFEAGTEEVTETSYAEETEMQTDREYYSQELAALREAVTSADRECIDLLQRGELPQTADNLMAVQALLSGRENILKPPAFRRDNADKINGDYPRENGDTTDVSQNVSEDGSGLWELLDDKETFSGSYASAAETAMKAVEEATFEADSFVDVRHMQLLHKQLHVASAAAGQEEYFLPMYVGDRLTRVHLRMDRSGEGKGNVTVDVNLEKTRVHAEFHLENGTLHGIFTAEDQNEVMKLREIADTFTREAENSWDVGNISVAAGAAGKGIQETAGEHVRTESSELYRVAKVFLHSVRQA